MLYFGEANVYQEDLDSFFAIAEEIKLVGLTGTTSSDVLQEKEEPKNPEPTGMKKEFFSSSSSGNRDLRPYRNTVIKPSIELVIPNQYGTHLQALDKKVKSMMEKGQRMIPNGKHANGMPKQATSSICKVCGKEDLSKHLRNHIEANHLEGVSIPCDYCGKICPSRHSLFMHKSRFHK